MTELSPKKLLTEPIFDKECTDPEVIRMMAMLGVPIERVEFCKEYNARKHGGSPYSKGYRFTDGVINKQHYILVSSGLPVCDDNSYSLDPSWTRDLLTGAFISQHNLFLATVKDTLCEIEVLFDQPDGRKAGEKVQFQPELFLDGKLCKPKSVTAEWVDDPLNPVYSGNTLVWDYEWCKRYMRIIEGHLLNWWEPLYEPGKEIRIVYNQSGDFRLRLGQFAVGPDEERVTPEQLRELAEMSALFGEPMLIRDSADFYPDAAGCVDGMLAYTYGLWNTIIGAGAATSVSTTGAFGGGGLFCRNSSWPNEWTFQRVAWEFDTSSLGSGASVSAASLYLRGRSEGQEHSVTMYSGLYGLTLDASGSIAVGDWNSFGTTKLSDTTFGTSTWRLDSTFNEYPLNVDGISAIDEVGTTQLGWRVTRDAENSDPGYEASKYFYIRAYFAEQGGGYKPKLAVTYSAGGCFVSLVTRIRTTPDLITNPQTGLGWR